MQVVFATINVTQERNVSHANLAVVVLDVLMVLETVVFVSMAEDMVFPVKVLVEKDFVVKDVSLLVSNPLLRPLSVSKAVVTEVLAPENLQVFKSKNIDNAIPVSVLAKSIKKEDGKLY